MQIGVLIPTYNHRFLIKSVLLDCLEYTKNIIVVIDGSTDGTLEHIQDLSIHILYFSENKGKGAALKAGFAEAEKLGWDYAITIDSDGQHKAKDLPLFLDSIEKNGEAIILGNRDMDLACAPKANKFGKKFTNFWLKIETGVDILDGQSGFRAYPVKKTKSLFTLFNGYEFEIEILARASWAQMEIVSIPIEVDYNPEGGRISHFRNFRDSFRASVLNTILVTLRVFQVLKNPRLLSLKKYE